MKRFFLAAGLLAGICSSASAADLARRVAPAPVPVVPVFTWTGFYVGVNAGYGFSDHDRDHDFFSVNRSVVIPPGSPGFFASTPTGTLVPNVFGGPLGTPVNTLTGVVGGIISPFGNVDCGGFFDECRRRSRDGFVGGVQSGYNFQFTPGSGFVIGYESDIQFADFDHGRRDGFGAFGFGGLGGFGNTLPVGTVVGTNNAGLNAFVVPASGSTATTVTFFDPFRARHRRSIDYFGTSRVRIGYAFDRFLVYGTGGFAYGGSRLRDNDVPFGAGAVVANFAASGGCGFHDDCNRTRFGYAAGGGIEYAFTDNFSAKLEGLYVDLRDRRGEKCCFVLGGSPLPFARDNAGFTYFAPVSAFSPARVDRGRSEESFAVVRAGLNYRFNFGR